ncbi:MAG: cupin domain-containing protein [Solirubrobacteraceae bacterium]
MRLTELELAAGERGDAYHWDQNNETWLIVAAGAPTVRTPDGEYTLGPGDLVCFPLGPDGAREIANPGPAAVRVLLLATAHEPALRHFPRDGTLLVTPPGALYRADDADPHRLA